jgi:hypothetical protein
MEAVIIIKSPRRRQGNLENKVSWVHVTDVAKTACRHTSRIMRREDTSRLHK